MLPVTLVPAQIASDLPCGYCSSALPFTEEFGHISTWCLWTARDQQQARGQQDWNSRIDTGQTIWGEVGQEKQFCVAGQGRITSEFGHGAFLGAHNIWNCVLVFPMLIRNPLWCVAWTCACADFTNTFLSLLDLTGFRSPSKKVWWAKFQSWEVLSQYQRLLAVESWTVVRTTDVEWMAAVLSKFEYAFVGNWRFLSLGKRTFENLLSDDILEPYGLLFIKVVITWLSPSMSAVPCDWFTAWSICPMAVTVVFSPQSSLRNASAMLSWRPRCLWSWRTLCTSTRLPLAA